MQPRSDFLFVVFGRVATALIAVASMRVMTALLTPADYGEWALLTAFQTFCGLFLINPVGQYINRHTHGWWDNRTLPAHLAQFNKYVIGVSLCIFIVVAAWGQSGHAPGHGAVFLSATAVGLIVYCGTWNATLVPLLNMLGFRGPSASLAVVTALAGLGCAAALVSYRTQAALWMLGLAAGMALGAGGAWHMLSHHAGKTGAAAKKSFSDFLDRKSIVAFCLPLAAATGFMWLQNTGYRFWVGHIWGVTELGLLAAGLGVSGQLWVVAEGLATQFFYPYFYRHVTDAQSDAQAGQALTDLLNTLGPIYAVFAGFNALCGAAILDVLTDARYHAAAPYVIFGAVIEFTRCLTNLLSNAAQAKRKTGNVILPYGVGAAVVWIGAVGAAHIHAGLTGLSYVLVAAGIAACLTMMILMRRLLPFAIDWPRWIAGLGITAGCFATANMVSIPVTGLYQNLAALLAAGTIACALTGALLWRNPALGRLLTASLRAK